MRNLTRDDLLQKLDEIDFFPELKTCLNDYLGQSIQAEDKDLIASLLEAGASPNAQNDLNDYMLYLLYEYEVSKTVKGELILSIMELLLKCGANPNRVAMNDLRAYDYAVARNTVRVAKLLEAYGADKMLRDVI